MNRVAAGLLLLTLAPLFALIAVTLFLTQGRPILFFQERVGKDFERFHVIKFRTMTNDAEKYGAQFAQTNDPRITTLGRILRASHLDELPQLWNVIEGTMNFIGPRPERKAFVGMYPCVSRWTIKPGITGWAQVHNTYLDIDQKCVYDEYYLQHQSYRLNWEIVWKTMVRIVKRANS